MTHTHLTRREREACPECRAEDACCHGTARAVPCAEGLRRHLPCGKRGEVHHEPRGE